MIIKLYGLINEGAISNSNNQNYIGQHFTSPHNEYGFNRLDFTAINF